MKQRPNNWGALLGAAFLMATSAVGPGFLTQTTVFTQQLGASFGFVILASILIDGGGLISGDAVVMGINTDLNSYLMHTQQLAERAGFTH